MKQVILYSLTASTAIFLSACESDDDGDVRHVSTTTTEETSVHQPVAPVTTETRTIRSY